jgi:ELWxxDGT repeat protein
MYGDGIHGLELWTSDGTTAGTILLKDINVGSLSSEPTYFTVCNGLLFFQATTPLRSQGLWVSDGTPNGTVMLGNQYSNPIGSSTNFISMNNKIYFQGNSGSGYGLWESDGTSIGTQMIKAGQIGISGGSHVVVGNTFYFQSSDIINGNELWKSDGTSMGTVLVKDINIGIQSSSPSHFYTDGVKTYFEANDGILGKELWVSDGTTAGTHLVKDVSIGAGHSNPSGMIEFNNENYYFAYNGSSVEMYKTDGTVIGTSIIKGFTTISSVTYSYVYNGIIYFIGSVTNGGTEYLFKSNGTLAGTQQITPAINTYSTNPDGFNMLGFNGNLFLPAYYDVMGNELCKLSNVVKTEDINELSNISIYPNPSSSFIIIHSQLLGYIDRIKIINSNGQVLQELPIRLNEQYLDLSKYPSGIYEILLKSKENVSIKKVIKN